jgi:hypothetical protein
VCLSGPDPGSLESRRVGEHGVQEVRIGVHRLLGERLRSLLLLLLQLLLLLLLLLYQVLG